MSYATKLQRVRKAELGLKAAEVIDLLIRCADNRGIPIMEASSLKTRLSLWENGHATVSEPYRRLFREIYGRRNSDLGFPDDEDDNEVGELRSRLALARNVDEGAVEAFRQQVDNARRADRQFGGVLLLEQLQHLIDQITGLLRHSTARGQREALAGVLTEASTLAGWVSLDRNAVSQAWNHYERAKDAAREAGSTAMLAHAFAEQAFVLIDIDEPRHAVEQLEHARGLGADHVSPLLQAWLSAAAGEGFAAFGQSDAALTAFDDATHLLPNDPQDPTLPFLFLGDSHLDRWRGNALAKVGDLGAVDQLAAALPRLPKAFVRARVGMMVDLAYAHAAAGNRDEAQTYARQARTLGKQIRSDRHLRRLSGLVLPTSRSRAS
ncbi:tetratricopeptide (TPR) repeat protein [Prauserella isguenensis]|uniref:Tetratricopeptide (TPR) repeat protein n=1 Tax=Prauserella isguenensis TaxID=1470180 RepID=A0A839S4R4_9PSEU|nr:tetratricopeptide repeat protein [Prauserella isguenensis]MBB3053091.1 tetratricopeptide (TPR) repeat protein [Prauserella isguenensis]